MQILERLGKTELLRLKIEKVSDIEKVELLYELERGKAEVIVLAKEKGINHVLIDEKIARMQAKNFRA